jgi:hypothetical protein
MGYRELSKYLLIVWLAVVAILGACEKLRSRAPVTVPRTELDSTNCILRIEKLIRSTAYYKQRINKTRPQTIAKIRFMADGIHDDGNFAIEAYVNSETGEGPAAVAWDWYEIRRKPATLYVLNLPRDSLVALPVDSTELSQIANHCIDWSSRN